jgi:hypothetical protein
MRLPRLRLYHDGGSVNLIETLLNFMAQKLFQVCGGARKTDDTFLLQKAEML